MNRFTRPVLITVLTAFTALGLNGCFLQARKLRDENNMLKERALQYQQDMTSIEVRYQQVQKELTDTKAKLAEAEKQLELTKDRNSILQRTMGESQRNQAETLMRDMEGRVQRENDLKLQVDELSARVETLTNERALMESQLQAAESKVGQLEPTVQELSAKVRDTSAELERTRVERDDARAERDDFRRQVQGIQSDASTAATELQKVSGQLRDREKELAAVQAELTEAKKQAEAQTTVARASIEQTTKLRDALQSAFAPDAQSGLVSLKTGDDLRVIIVSDRLFEPGTVLVSNEGGQILGKLAKVLASNEFSSAQVEGHTDSTPVKNMPFIDNWDLAAGRASAVTRFLARQPGVPARKLSAASYAFFSPAGSNDTPEGRKLNRRVEIVIRP